MTAPPSFGYRERVRLVGLSLSVLFCLSCRPCVVGRRPSVCCLFVPVCCLLFVCVCVCVLLSRVVCCSSFVLFVGRRAVPLVLLVTAPDE